MAGSDRKTRASKPAASSSDKVDGLRAELDELRRENEELKQATAVATTPGRWRPPVAVLLVIVGCLLAALAVPAVWINRTVMNTDRWVETVGPLSQQPAIQNAVADAASNALFARVNVEKLARDALPPKAQFLAKPLATQVETYGRSQARALTHSPQFSNLWIEVNRRGHAAVLAMITGKEGKHVSLSDGKVTLDLGPVVANVKARLDRAGLGAVTGAIGNVSGTYTLFESPALAQAGETVSLMNDFALALPLLTLAFLAGGVAVAKDRRRVLLWVGVGLVIAMLVPLEAIYLARFPYVSAIERLGAIPNDAALAVYDTVLAGLLAAQRAVLALGLVIWLGAALAGPSRFAVRLRTGVQGGLRGIGSEWDFGPFGVWVHEHRPTLRTAGIVTGVLALLVWDRPGVTGVIWTAVAVLVWAVLVEFFGRETSPEKAEEAAGAKPRSRSAKKKAA